MKPKKIILINSGYNIAKKTSRTPIPPFGLLSLSSVLENEGFDVDLKDFEFSLFHNLDAALLQEIRDDDEFCLFIGTTFITGPGLKRSFRIIDFIRKKFGDRVPLVAGGPHATIFYEELLRYFAVDIVCLGEGEATIIDLARCLASKGDLSKVQGIAFKKKEEIVKTAERPMIKDLSSLPMYAWKKIDVKQYLYNGTLTVLFSRGCPYRCTFCLSQKFLGEKPRTLTPDEVIKEIIMLKTKYGIKKFRMVDDLPFAGSKKLLQEFCDLMIQAKTGLKWKIWGRINNFTLELAELLRNAGCEQIHFGIESGSKRILLRIKKDIDIDSILKSAEICQKVNIEGLASFIVGFPFEEIEDVVQTRKLISLLNKRNMWCAIHKLTPFPSTQIWQECLLKGLKAPKNLKDWEKYGKQCDFTEFLFHIDLRVKLEIWITILLQFCKIQYVIALAKLNSFCNHVRLMINIKCPNPEN